MSWSLSAYGHKDAPTVETDEAKDAGKAKAQAIADGVAKVLADGDAGFSGGSLSGTVDGVSVSIPLVVPPKEA